MVSHTSDLHPWFVESARDRTNPRADWYTWADPKPDGTPPNNWLSHFGGPAWTWNSRRRQYYFHNFLSGQPDLNYHNPEVRAAAAIRAEVERLSGLVENGWICWSFSNHDAVRMISRWGLEGHAAKATPPLTALLLSLRGSSCLYQGEELGLPEAEVPYERLRDPHGKTMWPEFRGRDGCRTPMPWRRHAPNGGFSPAEPWLPVPDRHLELAVDRQEAAGWSMLKQCRRFIKWRKGVNSLPATCRRSMAAATFWRLSDRRGSGASWRRSI